MKRYQYIPAENSYEACAMTSLEESLTDPQGRCDPPSMRIPKIHTAHINAHLVIETGLDYVTCNLTINIRTESWNYICIVTDTVNIQFTPSQIEKFEVKQIC